MILFGYDIEVLISFCETKMEKKKKFSEKMAELEKIVGQLSSDIEIEEAVDLYEKGVKLARSIKSSLNEAEKKITVLSKEGIKEKQEDELGKE